MSTNSAIEWTGSTWNPVAGCSIVSPGCKNCYAMRMAARLEAMGQAKYAGTTRKVNRLAVWTGKINLDEQALTIPLRTKKPTTWFVNSMSDLFHEGVPFEFVDKVFAVMALTPHHTYQILTKRAERMAEYMNETWQPRTDVREIAAKFGMDVPVQDEPETRRDRVHEACEPFVQQFKLADTDNHACWDENDSCKAMMWRWPLPNVHLGVSVEDQERADERIPHLLRCPAAVRFLSCEPLLEELRLRISASASELWDGQSYEATSAAIMYERERAKGIGWVIVGGESGAGARPCHVDWVRSIVQQCRAAGVPCFVKQLGANVRAEGNSIFGWPLAKGSTSDTTYSPRRIFLTDSKGGDPEAWPADLRVREMPRAAVPA